MAMKTCCACPGNGNKARGRLFLNLKIITNLFRESFHLGVDGACRDIKVLPFSPFKHQFSQFPRVWIPLLVTPLIL